MIKPAVMKAICDCIETGVLAKDSSLTVFEFEVIHRAVRKRIARLEQEQANAARRALVKMQRDMLEEIRV